MASKRIKDNITPSLNSIANEIEKLPQEVYKYWKSITPIRSGNARRKTTIRGDVIHANYPYATRLDEGYSKQAPKGMVEPTNKYVADRVKRILRK